MIIQRFGSILNDAQGDPPTEKITIYFHFRSSKPTKTLILQFNSEFTSDMYDITCWHLYL